MNLKEIYLENLAKGLETIFCQENKRPAQTTWRAEEIKTPFTEEELDLLLSRKTIRPELKYITSKGEERSGVSLFGEVTYIGIVTGRRSQGLEVIDFDTYKDRPEVYSLVMQMIKEELPEIYSELRITQTKSGGYHIYIRTENPQGNQPLARIQKDKNNTPAIIETRGEGGYVIAPPSQGYTIIEDREPPLISTEQRDALFNICRRFDEIIYTKKETKAPSQIDYKGKTSIDDFNERGSILDLLSGEGWEILNTSGDLTYIKRPGTTNENSGNYSFKHNCLVVFSTSTAFEPNKPYNPSEVFNLLKSGGDWKKTAKELGLQGYGDSNFYSTPPGVTIRTEDKLPPERTAFNDVQKAESVLNEYSEGGVFSLQFLEISEFLNALSEEGQLRGKNYGRYLAGVCALRISEEFMDNDLTNYREEFCLLRSTLGKVNKKDFDFFLNAYIPEPINKLFSPEILDTIEEPIRERKAKFQRELDFRKLIATARDEKDLREGLKTFELNNLNSYSDFLETTPESLIYEYERTSPEDLETSISLEYGKNSRETLRLPSGAISVIAGATGHGKTLFLGNLFLDVANRYKDKTFLFLSYEERPERITQYLLNSFVNIELNNSEFTNSNRKALRDYYKGKQKYINENALEVFEKEKEAFFRDFIDSGRLIIKGVNYDSLELERAIKYAKRELGDKLGGVFIDYFQLINLPTNVKKAERTNTRQEELKKVCQDLNQVAKESGLPLILGAQFNRSVMNPLDLLPQNIGEAGDIERIVNTLIGLWNFNKPLIADKEEKAILSQRFPGLLNELGKTLIVDPNQEQYRFYIELLKSRDLSAGYSATWGAKEFNEKTGNLIDFKNPLKNVDNNVDNNLGF
jgi:hypothetical protein